MSMKKQLSLISLCALTSCGDGLTPISKPSDGYDAIRFKRTVKIDRGALNDLIFQANSVYVADRRTSDGKPCYFGTFVNGVGLLPICLEMQGNNVVMGLGTRYPIDLDAIERIKVQ